MRFFSTGSIGFWPIKFFNKNFPDYKTEFSIINGTGVVLANLISIYIGGVLGDYYENTYPQRKTYIAV